MCQGFFLEKPSWATLPYNITTATMPKFFSFVLFLYKWKPPQWNSANTLMPLNRQSFEERVYRWAQSVTAWLELDKQGWDLDTSTLDTRSLHCSVTHRRFTHVSPGCGPYIDGDTHWHDLAQSHTKKRSTTCIFFFERIITEAINLSAWSTTKRMCSKVKVRCCSLMITEKRWR